MFRIAICDDEPTIGAEIERILTRINEADYLDLHTEVFLSGEELCKMLESGAVFHLLYLDVRMKLLDGIEVSRKIREEYLDESLQIVYISSSQSHTMQMFENRPMNFLPKPVSEEDIKRTLQKAMSLWSRDKSTFEFNNNNKQYRVQANEIVYFESDNKKIFVHTLTNTLEFYGKLSQVEQQLGKQNFVGFTNLIWLTISIFEKPNMMKWSCPPGFDCRLAKRFGRVSGTLWCNAERKV